MSDVSKIIAGLSAPEQRALLAKLMAKQAAKPKTAPMSFAQERMWFLDRFQPGLAVYNITNNFFAPSPVNEQLLKRVFEEIIRRHETLRTTFRDSESGAVQVIMPPSPLGMEIHDLRNLSEKEHHQKLHDLIATEASKPFDLESGPLIRIGLARVSQDHAYVLMTMHHIITDGWSTPLFLKEFEILYQAFQQGRPPSLPDLPLQYADYARWQREWLRGEVLEKQLDYWKGKLAGMPEVLDFPFDRPRSPNQTFEGGCQDFLVPAATYQALLSLTRSNGATLFMTLLAAFKVWLARLSGQKDIVVGIPVANRTRSEIESLIGLFVNTLVLRTDLRHDPSFIDVLDQVRGTSLEALSHQDLPFEKLVEELQPERDMSYNPLFQVSLHLQVLQGENQQFQVPELDLSQAPRPLRVSMGTAKFDINLVFWEGGGQLIGAWEYSTALFDHTTTARLIAGFISFLDGIAADPNRPVSKLPIMAAWEYKQLADWNPEPEALDDRPVHRLFEIQARESPRAPALRLPDEVMSFEALDDDANRLAHYLQSRGVQPHHRVGICLDLSKELVVAVLGVLKVGAVIVPLEPTDPVACVTQVLGHTELSLIISRLHLMSRLPEQHPAVFCLESWAKEVAGRDHANPNLAVSPDNGAYLSFTSRSEVICRGVLLTHRQLSFSIRALLNRLEPTPAKRVLQYAPLAVNTALLEIFYALLSGQTLCIPGANATSGDAQAEKIREVEAEIAFCPPSVLALQTDTPPPVRVLAVNGEPGPYKAAAHWDPDFRVFEFLGCDEVCLITQGAYFEKNQKPALGMPVPGAPVRVMDENFNQMPIGTFGRLCIGGAALPVGYHCLPGLTAARFVPDPYSNREGARLFITRDLVRYLPDGKLEYLGKTDKYFKQHGISVELWEIESMLMQAVEVAQAFALPVPEAGLVVYLVCSQPVTPEQMIDHLAQRLPRHMMPDNFVFLDQMPLLETGKIDVAALALAIGGPPDAHVPPDGPLEMVLAEIWGEVLDVPQVGRHDNFFVLGGHSLLVYKVISRVRDALGVGLTYRSLFDFPTIASLVRFLIENQPDAERILKTAELLVKLAQMEDTEVEHMLDKIPSS
ncbi:MAG: condensation domain-containing protein [Acidobacteriota bacterium]|nr:condensation domain-containing protein [Acidobacteriota bacterium]